MVYFFPEESYQRMKQLRIFPKLLFFVLISSIILLSIHCGNEETKPPTLPGGCSQQGVNAIAVLGSSLTCTPTNAFTDVTQVIGPPDAGVSGPGKNEFRGMLSLGINGSVTLYLGSCIQDLPGPDLRIYQVVSQEAVEVQVSQNQDGPFVSLGMKDCGTPGSTFANFCDFDLAGSGLNNVRVIKVIDREVFTFPGVACDNAGSSPGADIDAVEVLHAAS
jgi:hypothetical protein